MDVRFTGFTEARVADRDGKKHITGYISVFNELSDPIFNFREIIIPGAFDEHFSEPDVSRRSYFNHNPDILLGCTENESASFSVDERGVFLDTVPPETRAAQDVVVLVRDGYVNHSSFSFSTPRGGDKWEGTPDNLTRKVHKAKLFEGGPVSNPAYPQSTAAVRSLYRGLGVDLNGVRPAVAKFHLRMNLTEPEADIVKRTMDILGKAMDIEIGKTEDEAFKSRSNIAKLKLQIELIKAEML